MSTWLSKSLNGIKLFSHRFDRRLNRYEWLHQKFHTEQHTIKEIADIIGCSSETVQNKLQKHNLLGRDKILNVYTGRFHSSKHLIMKLLKKRYLGKIEQSIDEVYPRIETHNAIILNEIFTSMIALDDDVGTSAGGALGMTRKETYTLAGKFGICLFDYDSCYEEMGNWFLQEIIRRRDEFVFDDACLPENWAPHRDGRIFAQHFMDCRKKKE